MNTKKIILILISVVVLLGIIITILSRLQSNTNTQTTTPSTTEESTPPTGIIVPTKNIQSGQLDIVSIDPRDQSTDIPLDRTITITFSRPFTEKEIQFFISPATAYNARTENNKLIITPQSAWISGTLYGFSINFSDDNEKVRLYRFTTTGTAQEYLPDTQPVGEYEKEQADLKNNNTDIYVTNQTPYEAASFTIESAFESQVPSHFYFTVRPKIQDDAKVREYVRLWLQLLDLTDAQIQSLDIRYP